jgi:hypothetical protein
MLCLMTFAPFKSLAAAAGAFAAMPCNMPTLNSAVVPQNIPNNALTCEKEHSE